MNKYKRYERYKDSGVEWIGEIPEHWELRKIKHIGMLSAGGVNKKIEEGEELFKSVHYMDVYRNSGKAIGNDDDYLVVSATQSQAKNCTLRKGDVLFTSSSETPDDIGHAVVISEDLEQTLYGYHLIRLRLDRDIPADYSYRKYMFNNHYIRSYFSSRTQGITRYGLKYDDYKEAVVFIPPISEQKTIANFLDQKTAVIDGLIADKEKLIELLQEKRQAIITEAVTKGLNPNVRMKDSGIEWIGEIPEHWRIVRLKFLKTSPFQYGANEPAEMDDPQLPRYIRITDINEKGDLREDTFKSLSWESAQPYLLKDGDILFARSGATVGKTFMYRGELGPACYAGYLIRFKPDKSKVNSYYIYYYTLSKVYEEWIKQNIIQATIQNVSAEKYGNLQVPLPPLEEQKGIVKYLNDKIEEIDILVESIYVQIQKLKEYRQSLISEAVTGKIDVRDYDVSN